MQTSNLTSPLIAALFGMEERFQKNLAFYLKGPCQGIAVIGSEQVADLDMIDGDASTAEELIAQRRQATASRPILVLSLKPHDTDERLFYIAKPIRVDAMMERLQAIRQQLNSSATGQPQSITEQSRPTAPASIIANRSSSETRKIAKHVPAPILNERNFSTFVGTLSHNDQDDSDDCINVNRHFLACVRTAYKSACEEQQIVKLISAWKPLVIFPQSNEIWLDADDNQLRAFANLSLNKMAGRTITLTPLDTNQAQQYALDKYQDIHSFIWKLAVWTSKGRYLSAIDIDKPVRLKHWPNFTRLVVTPQALRITALLINQPCLPREIPEKLDIAPQFVFVFLSACCSIGLLVQRDALSHKNKQAHQGVDTQKQSLFNKILSKLRGA